MINNSKIRIATINPPLEVPESMDSEVSPIWSGSPIWTVKVSEVNVFNPSDNTTVAEYVPSSVSGRIVNGRNIFVDLNASKVIVEDIVSAKSDASILMMNTLLSGALFSISKCIVVVSPWDSSNDCSLLKNKFDVSKLNLPAGAVDSSHDATINGNDVEV